MDSASYAWLAVCALLMLVLLAGFAAGHAGNARAKNAVHALVQAALGGAVVCLAQWAVGLRLALGNSVGGWFGSGVIDLPADPLPLLFQTLGAAVPWAIACGAVAERMRLAGLLAFAAVLGGVIQPVAWHWTQHPGGWLVQLGLRDVAGAAALQSVGAWSALAALWVTGPRLGRYGAAGDLRRWAPHNLPLVAIGAGAIWLGWCGLIGQRAGDGGTLGAWLWHLQLGGCAGACVAAAWTRLHGGIWSLHTLIHGALAGLVALSAGATVVSPLSAVLMGAGASAIALAGATQLHRLRLDDATDAVATHGLAAVWGLLATAVLQVEAGGGLWVQALAALAVFAWTFPVAYGALRVIDRLMGHVGGLRVTPRDEMLGLDHLEHGALAYPERGDSLAAVKMESQ